MPDAKSAKIAGRQLSIIVPGTWANVPVDGPISARRFVKDLVRSRVGTEDRLASLRAELVDVTMRNVMAAMEIGVHTYLMSFELLPSIPFTGAMLMADIPWPDESRPGLGDTDIPRALREGFPGGAVLDLEMGPVLRTVETTESALEGQPITSLDIQYQVPYPTLEKVLYIRVNLPVAPALEPILRLFDRIVDTITFLDPPDQA